MIENDNAKFCRKCGTKLPETVIPKKSPQPVPATVTPPTPPPASSEKKTGISDGILLGANHAPVHRDQQQSQPSAGNPISLRPEPEISTSHEVHNYDASERRTMFWAVKRCFSKYATFSGRASRSEFWYFVLFNFMINFVLFGTAVSMDEEGAHKDVEIMFLLFAMMLYSLLTMIPGLAVAVRRLHDIGKSGWNYLLAFVPIVGSIVLLIWFCWKSEPTPNKWGPEP